MQDGNVIYDLKNQKVEKGARKSQLIFEYYNEMMMIWMILNIKQLRYEIL